MSHQSFKAMKHLKIGLINRNIDKQAGSKDLNQIESGQGFCLEYIRR